MPSIVDGEPFASDLAGREEEECLPPALRYKYDRRGTPDHKRRAARRRSSRDRDGRRIGFLKLVAGMLGVGLDELVQRDTIRRQRRLAIGRGGFARRDGWWPAGLAVTAIQARDAARDQRREAEGLVGFMLGDLKDKLEPIGRLDVLDSVGARALAYYRTARRKRG